MNAESQGYAIKISFSEITEESLRRDIKEILHNEKYSKNAKKISHLLKDNPVEPMAEAMFWIEYVIRHKGAKHLKSAAVYLPWYQYMMLDILGLFICILLFILIVSRRIITKISHFNYKHDKLSKKIKKK